MRSVAQRLVVREALLALLVVALTFLNFGHTSAVFASGGRVVVTASSVCGDPLNPSAGDHFACHACRPGAVALPPAPVEVAPVVFCATPVAYAQEVVPAFAAPILRAAAPRGPPALV